MKKLLFSDKTRIKINEKGKRSIDLRHPWIYQRSCETEGVRLKNGELVVAEYNDNVVALAFYFGDSLFALKILEFYPETEDIQNYLKKNKDCF